MLTVAAAIIVHEGRILAAQRSPAMANPLKWEFPGGKVEPGEQPEDCIRREIREELQVEIRLVSALPAVLHPIDRPRIQLLAFTATLAGGQALPTEHSRIAWLPPEELSSLDWTEPDLPLVAWCISNADNLIAHE